MSYYYSIQWQVRAATVSACCSQTCLGEYWWCYLQLRCLTEFHDHKITYRSGRRLGGRSRSSLTLKGSVWCSGHNAQQCFKIRTAPSQKSWNDFGMSCSFQRCQQPSNIGPFLARISLEIYGNYPFWPLKREKRGKGLSKSWISPHFFWCFREAVGTESDYFVTHDWWVRTLKLTGHTWCKDGEEKIT